VTASRFAGRVALVTGGSRGIGRAVAARLAQDGATVVVNYLQAADEAESAVEEIVAKGGQAIAVQADVTDEVAVRHMVRATVRRFGRVDLLVANAGVVRDELLGAMTLDQWEAVIATNLRGPFLCIREAMPFLMSTGAGNVVCLTSIAAERGGRGHGNYVAAKGGVNALVRSLAVELAPKRIRVNAVSPGLIRTDMTRRVRELAEEELLSQIPLRRFGSPEEVAAAVCFLASDDADYITGEVLHVTGGFGL
jgi:3-oxoacyl-[acyl-carrier protein] reductase